MSWSAEFIAELDNRQQAPVIFVQPLNVECGYGQSGYSLGSIAGAGSDAGAILMGLRTVAQTLQVREWTTTLGGFAFRVVGDVQAFIEAVPRGTILGLYVTLGDAGIERVGAGTVATMQHSFEGAKWTGMEVVCVDIARALQGRLVNASGAHPLFYTAGSTSTLTADSAVADGTYDLATTSTFGRRIGGSYPYGAVLVASAAGNPYWRLWSAKGATTLTIQGAATASLMGTTDIGATTGDTITEGWYLYGHPLDIVREVLVSRDGDGAAGVWDILPEGWGIGLGEYLIDNGDIDAWKASDILTPSSGSYIWQIAGVDQVDNPWSWMTDWLGKAGYFFAMRQGCLTVRPAQNLNAKRISTGIEIDDSDIVSVEAFEVWDGDCDREYYQVKVVSVAATSNVLSATMSSLPAGDWYPYDVSDRLWANETAVTAMEADRLALAVVSIAERAMLTCAGLRLAVLSLGDMVYLNTALIPSRYRGMDGFLSQRAMVTSHKVDWMRGVVLVGLALWPVESEA